MDNKISELVHRYSISISPTDESKLRLINGDAAKKSGDLDVIIAEKQNIIAYLKKQDETQKRECAERQAKIDAIPGLKELENAIDDLARWEIEFEESFDDCGGLGVRPKPQYDLDAMRREFPRAAAYLKARSYQFSPNFVKSAAGEIAANAIIDGAGYESAIEKMEKSWHRYCNEHLWD